MLSNFGKPQARALLPRRSETDNKSHGGRCLIIAGSEGMFGAAVLSATAAARAGAGYVLLLTDLKKFPICQHPDFLTADSKKKKIKDLKFNSLAIGPGMGVSSHSLKLLKEVLNLKIKNVVIDADALNLCAQNKIFKLPATWVATPHEGELARLLGVSSDQIQKNRIKSVQLAQKKLGCVVLLKGHETLVASSAETKKIKSGNVSLAKAGTGDVLTGIIAALMSQGLKAVDAASLGAYIHGAIADFWLSEKKDELSLMASDLLELLPLVLNRIRKV